MRGRVIIILILLALLAAGFWFGHRQKVAPQTLRAIPTEVPHVSLPVVVQPLPHAASLKKVAPPPKHTPSGSPATPAIPAPAAAVPVPVPVLQTHPILAPPLTTEPPAAQEWKGNSDTSITHTGQIVVQTDEQWIHFWAEHHPGEAAPEVDFSSHMVVGVFLGLRPSDGFVVTITNIHPDAGKLVVDYIQLDPPPGTFQMGVTAYPYDIKVIPRSNLHVTFNRLTPQYQRGAPVAATK